MPRRGAWRDLARCRGVDPEIFFPVGEWGPSYDAQVAVAKAICAVCAVRGACLEDALAGLPFGIAGGLTPAERRKLAPYTRQRECRAEPAGHSEGSPPSEHVSRAEVIRAGRAALAAGRPQRAVARECGVTLRTVERWAASNRRSDGVGAVGQDRLRQSPIRNAPISNEVPRLGGHSAKNVHRAGSPEPVRDQQGELNARSDSASL